MTRLRKALERAQTLAGSPPSTLPPEAHSTEGRFPDEGLVWPLESGSVSQPEDDARTNAAPPLVPSNAVADHPQDFSADQVNAFNYELLNGRAQGKLVVGPEMEHSLVEQYRRLAATLHHAQRRTGNNLAMVSSAVEAEGKTLTATNIALTLSHSYRRRVLLVDADLRRPTIHEVFGLDNRTGLNDVLKETIPTETLPVQQVSATLWVMTAGRPDPDPMSGLISDQMRQFLAEAAETFDWVIIDTPPVALMPDANLLAAMIDTALLVISASSTPYPLVAKAVEALGPERILGVVLNRAERSEMGVGYGYYNSYYGSRYGSRYGSKSKPRRRLRFALNRKD